MQSNCPHCHSARHNLCEPGFTVKISKATWSPDFSFDASPEAKRDMYFIPLFADGTLGPFSQLLDQHSGGSVRAASKQSTCHGLSMGLTTLKNEPLLFVVEVGERKDVDAMKLCQIFGTALEEAVCSGVTRLIFPLVDISPDNHQANWWQIAAASARCRLATLLCNAPTTGALKDVLVVVPEAQFSQVAQGLSIDGPFCKSCPEPRLCQNRRGSD